MDMKAFLLQKFSPSEREQVQSLSIHPVYLNFKQLIHIRKLYQDKSFHVIFDFPWDYLHRKTQLLHNRLC